MTDPLVTAEVSLRGLPWMRLDTARLLDSDLFAKSTGDEFKAAVALWCKSWTQLPAGSLPNDDEILGTWMPRKITWSKVKAMALRGWVLCGDGRLYHPVVAEQVKAAWEERQKYLAKHAADNERKQRERDERARLFDELAAIGQKPAWNTKTATLRELLAAVTGQSRGKAVDVTSDIRNLSPAKDGTGRDGKSFSSDTTARSGVSEGSSDVLARALQEVGFPECSPSYPGLFEAEQEGVTPTEIRAIALKHVGKPLAYVLETARGKRRDAVDRAAKPGAVPVAAAIDPAVRAEAEAREECEREIYLAKNDLWLELIDPAKCAELVAEAKAKFRAKFPGPDGSKEAAA